jgi:hypothetical protein
MVNDAINATFELAAGLLLWLNCRQLYRDKEVRGVSVLPVLVFTAWGFWNLYFYPSLDQWLSGLAAVLVVSANVTWVGQLLYYSRQSGCEVH